MTVTTATYPPAGFYHIHATLKHDASCYVERQADRDLYNGLIQGKFCYILTSRQVGKSSLMVRTGWRLRENGIAVATLDLQAFGQNLTAEQWYGSLVNRIGRQLKLADELEEFWEDNYRLGPMQRWMEAIRKVVLTNKAGCVVIFVDEIETTRGLSFSADEFFAGIREFYNRRVEDDEMKRLTFCLLGASTPSDLIKDTSATLFNIGERIDLTDFTEAEGLHLAAGLGRPEEVARKLIKRILYWTDGHPYLTQRLCIAVGNDESVVESKGVDRLCESLFLCERAREQDDNLIFVRERLLRSTVDTVTLLHRYRQILKNERLPVDDSDPLIATLQLSGIAKVGNGCLSVRNRIYRTAFDRKWIETNIPSDEQQRQREALRRGRRQAGKIATPIILLIVVFVAVLLVKNARKEVEHQNVLRRLAEAVADDQKTEAERARLKVKDIELQNREMQLQADLQKTQAQKALWLADLMAWEKIEKDGNDVIIKAFREIHPHEEFDKKAKRRIAELNALPPERVNGVITGQVQDQATSQPLPNVKITAKSQDDSEGTEWARLSRPNGWFFIAPLTPGTYTLIVESEGYQKQILKDLKVSPEKARSVTLQLRKTK